MTQEQKDLLIKDLCSRLPYGVKVLYDSQIKELQYIEPVYDEVKLLDYTMNYTVGIEEIKPYLFPCSSMTEEQKKELNYITDLDIEVAITNIKNDTPNYITNLNRLNWLLKNHFDIYDLIPMGIAEDATGLNIY